MFETLNRTVFKQQVLVRIITAMSIAGSINLFVIKGGFDTIDFVTKIDPLTYLMGLACLFLLQTLAARLIPFYSDTYMLAGGVFVFCILLAARLRNEYFSFGLLFILAIVGYYLLRDDNLTIYRVRLNKKSAVLIVVAAALFLALFIGSITVYRYIGYSTSTYDMGIFSQMFYYMKETLMPLTTCERNGLMSHFSVHLSPAFYLLLPGYFLFPSPVYLQIMQGVVVASAAIPLFMLARRHGLSYKVATIISVAFCFHPSLAGGCFYDIHENMFLTPMVIWLLYFMEGRQWKWMYLFALLTCMVKEDAAVYVASIALFLFFVKKEKLQGALLFIGSVLYFLSAFTYISYFGEGPMTGRYGNFIPGSDSGLFSVIKTILFNPAYLFSEVFNQEKVLYMLLMLLPVAFLPILNRKLSQMVLLIPFLIVNLITDYSYQYSLFFQYNFGSVALLYYLVIINLPQFGKRFKRYVLPFMTVASVILFVSQLGGYTDNFERYYSKKELFDKLDESLAMVPSDASVQASGYFVPKLSSRRELYDIYYNYDSENPVETDYIVIDMRPGVERESEKSANDYLEKGYEIFFSEKDIILILKKPEG
ncbi:MAG: DUF2079 domain-containing protein [Clostridiales bacterium]|nr:DUF2079 domain-containing protein [Clostridiales bacterium]